MEIPLRKFPIPVGKLACLTSRTLEEFLGEILKTALNLPFERSFKLLQNPQQHCEKFLFKRTFVPARGLARGAWPGRCQAAEVKGSGSTGGANAAPRFHTQHAAAQLAPSGSQHRAGWLLDPPAFRR